MNSNYSFDKRIAVKIIVENHMGEVLLIREPKTNEWMPGRWGLPGGKSLIKESLYQTYKRKLKEEMNLDIEPLGVFKIEILLFEDRSVYMFHMVTKISDRDKPILAEHKWVNMETLNEMKIDQFTEYFNKDLISKYLNAEKKYYPMEVFSEWEYYKMSEDGDFKTWLNAK